GEDLGRAGASRQRRPALYLCADRSDDRRRHCVLRHARRFEHRGAEGADRIRGAARDRADHPPDAAGRISAGGVSRRTRHGRSDYAAGGDEADPRAFPSNLRREVIANLVWLESLQGSGIRPGLGRMRAVLRALRHPERAYPSIIVAGTNGKGSTSATLASILSAAGRSTGLYTSPHLVDLRERWMIGGRMIGDG